MEGERLGAGELVINSIDTDGVRGGFDLELLAAVAERVHIPIIASGGAGGMEDFRELFLTIPGVDAGLAASIFHFRDALDADARAFTLRCLALSHIKGRLLLAFALGLLLKPFGLLHLSFDFLLHPRERISVTPAPVNSVKRKSGNHSQKH